MSTVKVSEITLPEHYVRESIKGKNVKDLLDIVAAKNGVTKWEDLVGKKVDWPFPEIEIGKNLNPKPEKVRAKKGEDKPKAKVKVKKWFPFEIIDGGHRWTVAKRLKMKEIDAITRQISEPVDRFLHQFRTNVGHGLRLDKDERDNAIRTLANTFNVKQEQLVKETGLDRSSVSRIINAKQRKDGPRKKATKTSKNEKFDTKTTTNSTTNLQNANPNGKDAIPTLDNGVEGFVSRLQFMVSEYPALSQPLFNFLCANTPKANKAKVQAFANVLRDIANTFDNAIKEIEAQPATQPKAG